jgi:hypothetical protein
LTGPICADNNNCTTQETCTSGVCIGKPVVCNDNNPCTQDICAAALGTCVSLPATGSLPCNDGNSCTIIDACQGGLCLGSAPVVCDDKDPCTIDACDPGSGKCTYLPLVCGGRRGVL